MIDQNTGIPAPRVPLKVEVEFRRSYSRSNEQGLLRNISLTGAFLQAERARLQPDDKITIVLKVAGRARKVQAQIVWSNERGCGIRFLHSSGRDSQIVDDLIGVVQETRTNKKELLETIFKEVA